MEFSISNEPQTVIFESLVLDEKNKIINLEDGTVMCNVIDNGQKTMIPFQESVLVENGLLVIEDHNVDKDETETIVNDPVIASDTEDNALWNEDETNFLLDKYNKYISLVGRRKPYRTKKAMWEKISDDLLSLNIVRTYIQCASRYKTVMKRKTESNGNKKTLDTSRLQVQYREIQRIPKKKKVLIDDELHDDKNNRVVASDTEDNAIWNEFETRFLFDKYNKYISLVGRRKTYPTKKAMWEKISKDLLTLNIVRTHIQCASRYKTVLKRKTENTGKKTSSSSRMEVEYEEIKIIADNDDNFTPEVLRGVRKAIITKRNHTELNKKRRRKPQRECMSEILLHIHQLKEEGRQKRHIEKLDLIRNILGSRSGNFSNVD